MLRRLLAAATAVMLLTGGIAVIAGPADARSKRFDLTGNAPDCNPCRTPDPYYRVQGDSFKVNAYIRSGNRRPYVVQERTAAGKWRVIRKKRTDDIGMDIFSVTHSQVGKYSVRAIAKRYHGHGRLVSNTMTWTVLLKTTVSAALSSTSAPANSSVTVTGSFSPASVRYAGVDVNDSRYGTGFRGWTMLSNPDGTFSISVPTLGPGTYRFRVDIAQSDTGFAAYLSLPPLHVS